MLVGVETEARDVVLRILRANRLQHADRDHVFRFRQPRAQAHRPIVLAVVVVRFPGLPARLGGIDHHRRVVDDGGRGESLLQSSRIDEGLETGAGLTPGLRNVVEFVAVEVEAAHQGAHAAVHGTDGDEGSLRFGNLHDLPVLLFILLDADQGAAADLLVRRGFFVQHLLCEFQTFALYGHDLPAAAIGAHLLRSGFQHHRDKQVCAVGDFRQRIFHILFRLALRRHFDVSLRAAVAVTLVVVQHTASQRAVRRRLIGLGDGGVDAIALRVHLLAEALEQHLPHHFRNVLGAHGVLVGLVLDHQLRLLRLGKLHVGDMAQFVHPAQHVHLALLGALGIDHRIEARRGFGQPGQHRGLGYGDVLQRLSVIDLCRSGEAVGTLTQVDLVDIDLQDFVLGQARLDLEGQQRLVQLARQRFLAAEEEIPGHLHGNGGGALTPASRTQVGVSRPDDPLVVHPGMLVEALILGGEDGAFHDFRDFDYGNDGSALLAELSDQGAFRGVHAQRHFGAVIGQHIERRQIRVGEQDHQTQQRAGGDTQSGQKQQRKGDQS